MEYFKVDLFGRSQTVLFSNCKRYRYAYKLIWDETKPMVAFIGLNPSTADEKEPDPTITKVTKIAQYNGFGGFVMLNLFSLITPYPADLKKSDNPNLDNEGYMGAMASQCEKVVFCWGAFKEAIEEAKPVIARFPNAMCLKRNKDGSPKHPLYCLDKTPLISFR